MFAFLGAQLRNGFAFKGHEPGRKWTAIEMIKFGSHSNLSLYQQFTLNKKNSLIRRNELDAIKLLNLLRRLRHRLSPFL
jgi:hypothetical protein